MKYKTKISAIKNLKKFFINSPQYDSIKLEDAYLAFNRDLSQKESNKRWITNLLTHLKYHDLVTSVYSSKTGKRVLIGLQLTMEGKRAIGRIQANTEPREESSRAAAALADTKVDILNVMKIVAKLREDNQEYEIVFDVRLKKDSTHSSG